MKMRGEQPWLVNRARALRINATTPEDRRWSELRARRLCGIKFVRQVPIGGFFADLVCRQRKRIVEIDGGTHSTPIEVASDLNGTAVLRKLGYRVLRFHNDEVMPNLDCVLDQIAHELGTT
jgi:very-short-patch-repair endonuclease